MKQISIRRFLISCAVAVECLFSAALPAFPASVKSSGMGGADEAYPLDSLAIFDNPASAAEIDCRFDISGIWQGWHKQLTISNRPIITPPPVLQEGTLHANNENHFFGGIGANIWFNECVAMGLAWTHYNDIRTRYGQRLDDFALVDIETGLPSGPNASFEYNVEAISAALAYRWNECHTLGVAVNVYLGEFQVGGVGEIGRLTVPSLSINSGNVSDNGEAHHSGVGVTIGWTGHFWPCLTTAISYSPKVHMTSVNRYSGFIAGHHIDIPETVRFGLAWSGWPCLVIAADGEYRRYGKVRAWSNRFADDSTTGFGPLFGSSDGPGFGWKDQWMARVGVEWNPWDSWQFRLGYRFESLPYSKKGAASALNVLTLQTVENYISAGATWNFNCESELSVFGEYGFSNTARSRYPDITLDTGETALRIFFPADLAFKSHTYRAGIAYGWAF